jgi:hypothetical protein
MIHNFYQCHLVGHRDACAPEYRPNGWTDKGWRRAKRRGNGTTACVYMHVPGHRIYRICEYGLCPPRYSGTVRMFG